MIPLRLLAISMPLNFAWEMLQMPAFAGLPNNTFATVGVCAIAAIGDALIALSLWRLGARIFGDLLWLASATLGCYTIIVVTGVVLHVGVEWVAAIRFALWTYRDIQPTLPGIRLGILPVLQPVLLLPLTFHLLGRSIALRA